MLWKFFFYEGAIDGSCDPRCTVGGQIVGYTNRLKKVSCDEIVKLGGAVGLKFNIGKTQYASIGTYWAHPNTATGSFQSHLERAYGGIPVLLTLKHGIAMAVDAATDAGRTVLVGGDFNSDLRKKDKLHLGEWIREVGLTNASRGDHATRESYSAPLGKDFHQSRIDHVFATDIAVVKDCVPVNPDMCVTQHLPVILRINIEYCVVTLHLR